jgi:hypothetical protein
MKLITSGLRFSTLLSEKREKRGSEGEVSKVKKCASMCLCVDSWLIYGIENKESKIQRGIIFLNKKEIKK